MTPSFAIDHIKKLVHKTDNSIAILVHAAVKTIIKFEAIWIRKDESGSHEGDPVFSQIEEFLPFVPLYANRFCDGFHEFIIGVLQLNYNTFCITF